ITGAGVPLPQTPPPQVCPSQRSLLVSHGVLFGSFVESEQAPVVVLHVGMTQSLVLLSVHVIVLVNLEQLPEALHASPMVQAFPSLQRVSSGSFSTFVQVPVDGAQVGKVQSFGSPSGQSTGVPLPHMPPPQTCPSH